MTNTTIPRAVTMKRILWAAIAWALSFKGVYFTILGLVSPPLSSTLFMYLWMASAWIFLAIMTIAWIRNHHCDPLIPIMGTLIGLPCAVLWAFFIASIPYYISTMPLAFYLVYWHLWTANPSKQAAA